MQGDPSGSGNEAEKKHIVVEPYPILRRFEALVDLAAANVDRAKAAQAQLGQAHTKEQTQIGEAAKLAVMGALEVHKMARAFLGCTKAQEWSRMQEKNKVAGTDQCPQVAEEAATGRSDSEATGGNTRTVAAKTDHVDRAKVEKVYQAIVEAYGAASAQAHRAFVELQKAGAVSEDCGARKEKIRHLVGVDDEFKLREVYKAVVGGTQQNHRHKAQGHKRRTSGKNSPQSHRAAGASLPTECGCATGGRSDKKAEPSRTARGSTNRSKGRSAPLVATGPRCN